MLRLHDPKLPSPGLCRAGGGTGTCSAAPMPALLPGPEGGGLQPRGRLSGDPLSPHEASPSSLLLGVPVGGGGVGLFSTPRGPGTGQGQAHPCHSPGLCTDVTLSHSLATTRQPGTHAPHSAPWSEHLHSACTAPASSPPPAEGVCMVGTLPTELPVLSPAPAAAQTPEGLAS